MTEALNNFNEYADLLHYGTIAFAFGISSIGVGIGEGLASSAAIHAINTQPSAQSDINRTTLIGMALVDTAVLTGFAIAILMFIDSSHKIHPFYAGIAELGIAFAICLTGFIVGIVSAFPMQAACRATAQQPFFSQTIFRFMILTQSIIQTPIIFGFIIAIFIRNQMPTVTTFADSLRLLSSGLAIGLGSIGPAFGLALFAKKACLGLGINRLAYNRLLPFTLISSAIIETPVIFALVISFLLLMTNPTAAIAYDGIPFIASALCIGLGTIGPGVSSGTIAATAANQIAHNPEQYSIISKTSMFAQGIIDTCAIYTLLIAFIIIFFH